MSGSVARAWWHFPWGSQAVLLHLSSHDPLIREREEEERKKKKGNLAAFFLGRRCHKSVTIFKGNVGGVI
jgi:hypothetical protein